MGALRHVAMELPMRRSVEAVGGERPSRLQGELMALALEAATEPRHRDGREPRPLELTDALKLDLSGG